MLISLVSVHYRFWDRSCLNKAEHKQESVAAGDIICLIGVEVIGGRKMTLSKYSFDLKTRIEFGEGMVENVAVFAKELGMTKVLLVADKGIIAAGLTKPVEKALTDGGIPYVIFDGMVVNPRDVNVLDGTEFAKREGIDGLVAVGGGGPMDCAKAIATLCTNGGRVQDYTSEANSLKTDPLPMIAIPTTAGTGSEVTWDAVITDSEKHEKLNVLDWRVCPNIALIDPTNIYKLPSHIMASCGVDAMTHAVEAYTCTIACAFTDAVALAAIEKIQKNLRAAVNDHDPDACKEMMEASTLAGVAFGYSDVGAVHCISEALGGRYDIPHGVANAILLPTITEFNVPADLEKHANVAKALGVDTSNMTLEEAAYSCVGALEKLCEDVNIPKMNEIPEIKPEEFEIIADASERNLSNPDNCREICKADYVELLNKAYYGK